MSLIAALVWKKSSPYSISTLIFNDESMEIVSLPKIYYLPQSYFSFRRAVNKLIKEFFIEITSLSRTYKQSVKLEYKIVFNAPHIFYLIPAKESLYVYKTFLYWAKQAQKKIDLKINSQLRKKLSGKHLKYFNKEIRKLELVRRKKDTRYEYSLWSVALHATPATYRNIIDRIKGKLMEKFWGEAS